MERAPPGTQPFLKNGAYFYKPGAGNQCPLGPPSPDGCHVGSWPSGAKPFIYEGAFYYVPLKGSKTCCPGVGGFDSKNCYLGPIPAGAEALIASNRHYVEPACLPSEPCSVWDPCPFVGTFDGRDCLVYEPPSGATAFVYDNNFYHTPVGCPSCCGAASFDTKNCFVGGVPSGAKPFVRDNNLYVEARKCPKLPKPVIPNVFTPNGDGINDLWGMKGVKDLCSVRAYVFNKWGVGLADVQLQPRGADTVFLWDGRTAAGTPVPEGGPYYYTVRIENCSGASVYSGYFHIYR